ncbi:MAG: hypothetical protein KUG79_06625 [Pseudomonadales bacterium]|nr:hypothetical protein [Pseudomonadales bacterium]
MSVSLLALAYALVAALVVNIWLRTSWSTAFKFFIAATVCLLYFTTYLAFKELQGQPSHAPLPATFRLIWATIQEPDKQTATAGKILLWAQELDAFGSLQHTSKLYQLDYDLALAEEIQQAVNHRQKGIQLNGRMTRGMLEPDKNLQQKTQAKNHSPELDLPLEAEQFYLEFTPLPQNSLPAKGP